MGKVLVGRYEMLKQVATGGMATVHLGRALGVGGFERLVAIKLMHPHISAEPEFVTMFLDEARLAARIRHPNVVPTLDVQESPDGLFLVMEYIEGPSLHQLIRSTGGKPGAVPLPVALRLMIDTLSGLHDAHELCDDEGAPLSLVHRDVSPANILIGTDGVARITDFGVARAEARLSSTRGGQLKGKIPYMPPEQLMSEQIDRRCDVYAAGAVMWELLVGKRLFSAESDGALLQKILAGPEASPRQIDRTTPESVDRVCMRALSKDQTSRFASAAEFAEALEHAAQEAGVTIATARVVASFVEQSGAFKKMLPKELAALKKGGIDVPAGPPSTPSGSSAPTSSPSGAGAPHEPPKSTPTAPSQITVHGSAMSARIEPTRQHRTGLWIGLAAAVAVALGALVALRGGGDAASSSAASTVSADATPTSKPADATVATAAPSPSATAAPSAALSQSATPSTAEPKRPAGRPSPPATIKPPPGGKPKPAATSYDPDRL